MSEKSIAQARAEVKANDPPIEPNQYWVGYNTKGGVFRRLRILALHPDKDRYSSGLGGGRQWIFQEMPTKFRRTELHLSTCPEFNLRYIFTLEGIHEG